MIFGSPPRDSYPFSVEGRLVKISQDGGGSSHGSLVSSVEVNSMRRVDKAEASRGRKYVISGEITQEWLHDPFPKSLDYWVKASGGITVG